MCPFCQKVLGEAERMGVSFDLRDTSNDTTNAEALIEKGGKRQVPFLIDEENGKSMYESDDIIAYLTEHHASAHAPSEECESCQ